MYESKRNGTMSMFRELDESEELDFRKWARENYVPFQDISGGWHPVVRDECKKINEESIFESPYGQELNE